ncbi:MAG: hypothetical protein JWP11_3427 [Frankiales bacterium]|nr:hypothetical protein [Frankiales bacterium]
MSTSRTATGRRTWTEAEVRALGLTTDITTAGSVLGIGRTKAQELARRGDWPTPLLRLGAHYRVPVLELLRLLGVEPPRPSTPESPTLRAVR